MNNFTDKMLKAQFQNRTLSGKKSFSFAKFGINFEKISSNFDMVVNRLDL